jgi:uncharacterized protein
MREFCKESQFSVPVEELFDWHRRPGALQRLIPPWESITVTDAGNGITDGSTVVLAMRKLGIPLPWHAYHQDYDEYRQFVDIQQTGPFAYWKHCHAFAAATDEKAILTDRVLYKLPLSRLSEPFLGRSVYQTLQRMFQFRHQRLQNDLALHQRYKKNTLRVAISGASGFVGTALHSFLKTGGHEVYSLVRKPNPAPHEIYWNPDKQEIEKEKLEKLDAVIHLAGKNIATQRWSQNVKEEILHSRVQGTHFLCQTLASLQHPPETLISASATGYYGTSAEETFDEESKPGDDFLAQVCQEWEKATLPAEEAGIRVVHARLGIVVSAQGGALAKMLLPFSLGLGGKIGHGRHWMSWISLDDVLGALYHCMNTASIHGPVNLVSPHAIRNHDFTQQIGHILSRPTLVPFPSFMVQLLFGEMGKALLLSSAKVNPAKLHDTGYEFLFPTLQQSLCFELGYSHTERAE